MEREKYEIVELEKDLYFVDFFDLSPLFTHLFIADIQRYIRIREIDFYTFFSIHISLALVYK